MLKALQVHPRLCWGQIQANQSNRIQLNQGKVKFENNYIWGVKSKHQELFLDN